MEVVFAPRILICSVTSSIKGIIALQPKGGLLILILEIMGRAALLLQLEEDIS